MLGKSKIKGRFMVLAVVTLTGSLLLSWLFASNFWEIMTMDYNAPDLVGTKQEIRHNFIEQISTWETLVDSSMFYLINFIPILFILPTLGLFAEKRSFYMLGRQRYPSFKKAIYKDVVQYVFLSIIAVVTSFFVFYSVGGLFVYRSIDNIGGFSSILPENFYMDHPYLFFMFMVCTIYAGLAIVFGLLSCALILLLDREYKVVLLILLIYFLYGKLGVYTDSIYFNIFASFTAFNTTYSTLEVFLPLIILLIISLILLVLGVRKTTQNIG